MIIAYEDHCSFQRCGFINCSGENKYNNLLELYYAETIDYIQLKRDWKDIKKLECFELELP
jgi:hypothetical protein